MGQVLQSGQFKSKTFVVDFDRNTESALITRNDNETDFLKVFSHAEVEELRDLLWDIQYDKLLVNEVKK